DDPITYLNKAMAFLTAVASSRVTVQQVQGRQGDDPITYLNKAMAFLTAVASSREHGRMILESVENGPLIWPTIEENDVTKIKIYVELSATEKLQSNCDMKATNIILQGLPADIYSLLNHHIVTKDL
nr:hypothetical protein [Tanacetum cinerariifolium]